MAMYKDVRSRVRVGDGISGELDVIEGVQTGVCPEPVSLNHFARGSIQGVSYRLSMEAALFR